MSGRGMILRAHDVVKRFGGIAALDGASLEVEEGSIAALIGPNGAGKTTLFNVASGTDRADQGFIRFLGRRIDGRPTHMIAGLGLVRTFQLTRPLPGMTVLENVMVAAGHHPGERLWRVTATPRNIRRRERAVEGEALELLRSVGLDAMAGTYGAALSHGQRRLLEFARALMTRPRMLLLDEPTTGLHPLAASQLLGQIRKIRDRHGVTFLLIEHDLRVVGSIGERVIVMNHGKVIAEGRPEEVARNPSVRDAYLGPPGGADVSESQDKQRKERG